MAMEGRLRSGLGLVLGLGLALRLGNKITKCHFVSTEMFSSMKCTSTCSEMYIRMGRETTVIGAHLYEHKIVILRVGTARRNLPKRVKVKFRYIDQG